MGRRKIIKYKFEEEYANAYIKLLEIKYRGFNHSLSYISYKNKLKNFNNPFFENGDITNFLELSKGDPIGHISAIIDPRLKTCSNKQIGLIGFCEFPDKFEDSCELISRAVENLQTRGCSVIRGPIDLTTWHGYRFAIGQIPKTTFEGEPMNPNNYISQFEKEEFKIAKEYSSLRRSDIDTMLEYSERVSTPLKEQGFKLKKITHGNFNKLNKVVYNLTQEIFNENWSFVPLTFSEFEYLYPKKQTLEKTIIEILEDPLGKEIGFSLSIPDRSIDSLIMKSVGILPEKKHTWGGILLGHSQLISAKNERLNSVTYALRKKEKITRKPTYEGFPSIRDYVAFEKNL